MFLELEKDPNHIMCMKRQNQRLLGETNGDVLYFFKKKKKAASCKLLLRLE